MFKIIQNFLDFCQEDNRRKFKLSVIYAIIDAIFEALKIVAIYFFVSTAFEGTLSMKTAFTCLGIMLVSIIGSGLTKNKSTILQTDGGYSTCALKRMEIAEHLRYVPMGYFNDNSLGQVISVATNTMETLENLATRVIMMVSGGILKTAMITIWICFFDIRIGLILIVGLIIFKIVNGELVKRSGEVAKMKDLTDEALVEQIVEYVEGISEVKSYKLTGEKCAHLNKTNRENAEASIKLEYMLAPYMGLQTFVIKVIGVVMAFASIYFYLTDSLSIVNCIMMIIASFIVYASLELASSYSAMLRNVDICIKKAQAIMKTEQMELDGVKEDPKNVDIEVKNISFSYEKKKIIDNVSFSIPEKTTTAIIGPSGGGKTTLTSLISRFWDVDEGEITLGGRNIKDYNYDTLMKNFSFVFQRVYLFEDTIANNIRFGTPEASMDQVIAAAKKARCHEFISALPNGYDTIIGAEGVNLSGGERQRISIARAIMKDAPIIVLDEATANIDPENENDLMNAIAELTKDKTIIMIAHRLKTVEHADQILVVENGHIVQKGTHAELIQQEGLYKRFIESREKAVSWKIA